MPNWVKSKLTVLGRDAEKLIDSLCSPLEDGRLVDDNGHCKFDFNKIIPMPKKLDVVSGTVSRYCAELFLGHIADSPEEYELYLYLYKEAYEYSPSDKYSAEEMMRRCLEFKDLFEDVECFKNEEEVYEYGKQILENYRDYGAKDWYDWCRMVWGTKWNACDSVRYGNEVEFNTAWSPVDELMLTMSKQHPKYQFRFQCANEDIGASCIDMVFQRGKILWKEDYVPFSKEAEEFALRLWNCEDDYEYDPEKGEYVPKDYD